MIALLLILAAGAVLLYIFLTWNFDFWKRRGVPFVNPVPFFGTIKDFILLRRHEGLVYLDHYNSFPDSKYVGGFQFRKPFLLIRDPDLLRQVLVKDFECFHDRGIQFDEERMPLSVHLFNLEGKEWRTLRAKLTPIFSSGKMRLMYQLMEECADVMMESLQEQVRHGNELELREVFAKFTTDVIGSCVMGLKLDAVKNPDSDFQRIGRKIWAPTASNILRWISLQFLPSFARLMGFSFEEPDVTAFFLTVVREMLDSREKNSVKRNDLIQQLLELKKHGHVVDEKDHDDNRPASNAVKDERKMTDAFLAAQVFVFFIAGFETSSTASSWILYELALNPDIQERLREEIDAVLKENKGHITYEALMSMEYLDKVWNEGLRKYPPATHLFRTVTQPYQLPDTDEPLPVGLGVKIPVYALHHDPKYYPEPERFDVERFSEEAKAARNNYTFLPFGEGPRMCVGIRFGVQQAKLGLVKLLSKYRFSPCQRTPVPARFDPKSIVIVSTQGIWLTVKPR